MTLMPQLVSFHNVVNMTVIAPVAAEALKKLDGGRMQTGGGLSL